MKHDLDHTDLLCPRGRDPSDCVEGTRLYERWERANNTYREFGRLHMMLFMVKAAQELQEHIDECEICEEELADETR